MRPTQVAKYIKTSFSFMKKWVNRYEKCGNVDDEPGRGRKRITPKKADKAIVQLFDTTPTINLKRAREKLLQKGIEVSTATIQRRLLESNIRYRSTISKPLLGEKHVEIRLKWAKENLERDWSNVIFTDESSFVVFNSYKRACSKQGERLLQRTVKHPAKVHVYGCFSSRGFGKLIAFAHNLNAERMVKLYQRGLLKSVEMMYGSQNINWILQEDNDPKHRSRLCTAWKLENEVETLD